MRIAKKELETDLLSQTAMNASNPFNLSYWKHPVTGAIKVVYRIPYCQTVHTNEIYIGGPGLELPGQQTLMKTVFGGMMGGMGGMMGFGMMGNRSSSLSMAASNIEPFKSQFERDTQGREGFLGKALSVAQVGLPTLTADNIDIESIKKRYTSNRTLEKVIVRDEPGLQTAFQVDLKPLKFHELGTVGIEWVWSMLPAEIKTEIRQWTYNKFKQYIEMHKPENMKKIWTKWQEKGTALWNLLTPNKTVGTDSLEQIKEKMDKIYKRKSFKAEKISLDMVRSIHDNSQRNNSTKEKFKEKKWEKMVVKYNKLCNEYIELNNKIDIMNKNATEESKKLDAAWSNGKTELKDIGNIDIPTDVSNEMDNVWAFAMAMTMGASIGYTINQVLMKWKGDLNSRNGLLLELVFILC